MWVSCQQIQSGAVFLVERISIKVLVALTNFPLILWAINTKVSGLVGRESIILGWLGFVLPLTDLVCLSIDDGGVDSASGGVKGEGVIVLDGIMVGRVSSSVGIERARELIILGWRSGIYEY